MHAFSARFAERAAWSAAIAQLVEHVIRNDGVTGSNPVCGTNLLSIKSRTQKPKAHCHLSLGKLFRRTGKRKRAHQHLTTAAAMYREMGVRFWLEQAEAELRQLQ